MEFSDRGDDGWEILTRIAIQVSALNGEHEAKLDLLLWMLQVTIHDVKQNFIESEYYCLVYWLLHPKAEDAAGLFLNPCGDKAVYARTSPEGYTVLMDDIVCGGARVRTILKCGPNIHATGIERSFSPFSETPTSLALYSFWAFANWLEGLDEINVDLEEFVDLEMQQTPLADAGWTTATLLALFEHDFGPDSSRWYPWHLWSCSDCSKEIFSVRVQPFWQHLLEKIKCGLDPDSLYDNEWLNGKEDDERGEEPYEGQAMVNRSMEPSGLPDNSASSRESGKLRDPYFSCDIRKRRLHSPSGYRNQSDWSCAYEEHELVCMRCWSHYKKYGRRWTPDDLIEESEDPNDSSDDEFSPFLFNI